MTNGGGELTNPEHVFRLTRDRRRAVCVHEAGHAVIHALGGSAIYRVAVAPEDASEWATTGRKGSALVDLWGVCEPSDLGMVAMFMRWEPGEFSVDRPAFRRHLRQLADLMREHGRPESFRREMYRMIRAHVCGALAGPVAEELYLGIEPSIGEPNYYAEWPDDFGQAQMLAWLLPWRSELDHLHVATVQMLRRPEVWAFVLALADELERAGEVADGIELYLPAPAAGWPPSPRTRVRRLPLIERHPAK